MQTVCDLCGCRGRLTYVPKDEPGSLGGHGVLLCDDCFEKRTGFVAECQAYCGLHLDHVGECQEK